MKKPENLRLLVLLGILVVSAAFLLVRMMDEGGLSGDQARAEDRAAYVTCLDRGRNQIFCRNLGPTVGAEGMSWMRLRSRGLQRWTIDHVGAPEHKVAVLLTFHPFQDLRGSVDRAVAEELIPTEARIVRGNQARRQMVNDVF